MYVSVALNLHLFSKEEKKKICISMQQKNKFQVASTSLTNTCNLQAQRHFDELAPYFTLSFMMEKNSG